MPVEAQQATSANDLVKLAIEVRGRKRALFGNAFAVDPGWDILLQLYAARVAGSRFSLDDLSDQYPKSALARWARVLEETGLAECQTDYLTPSAQWFTITERGELKMREAFETGDRPVRPS